MTILMFLLGYARIGLAWIKALPWYVLALAGCAVVIVWQHHAETSLRDENKALNATLAQVKDAQTQATVIAQQALRHTEAVYQAKAQEADHAYQTQLAAAQSAADRYIAGHRVHAAGGAGSASSTPASPQGGSAAVPESLPADAVVVSAGDVQACTSAVTYGVAAHDWALGLGK